MTYPKKWCRLTDNPRKTLRTIGVSFEDQDELDLTIHLHAEDKRYPMLIVQGDLNFGVDFDPDTLMLGDFRDCICHAKVDDTCICDTTIKYNDDTL